VTQADCDELKRGYDYAVKQEKAKKKTFDASLQKYELLQDQVKQQQEIARNQGL
jgi:hypothetical protein